ncbi:hypothetical protein EON62_02315 [archaeon]|nr:MAG: hypothetical protein EON62_02315 [archaeon]
MQGRVLAVTDNVWYDVRTRLSMRVLARAISGRVGGMLAASCAPGVRAHAHALPVCSTVSTTFANVGCLVSCNPLPACVRWRTSYYCHVEGVTASRLLCDRCPV